MSNSEASSTTATVQGGTGINVTYNYPTGSNNGKVSSVSDALSGETVTYQYDSLNRLISAAGSGWTQTQSYDGFGNLTGRVGTGTAQSTSMSTPADATTNRLSGYSYDANGNQLSTGNVFDAENRLAFANISGGMVEYFYDAQNKRIWQGSCTQGGNCQQGVVSTDTVTLFGVDGRLVATYQWSAAWTNTQNQVTITFQASARRAYFGGKLVSQSQSGVMLSAVQDRLGSVGRYYPYGEERNAPPLPNDQVKFATYTRDSGTGLDYADQRYYASTFGRFMTPDPYWGSASLKNPQSLNRFAYVLDDPVNNGDPLGLCAAMLAGITMNPDDTSPFDKLQMSLGGVAGFPYSGSGFWQSVGSVTYQAAFGRNASTAVALATLKDALNNNSGPIDVIAYSGGAQAFATALNQLSSDEKARIGNVLYISPGMIGTLPTPNGPFNVTVVLGTEGPDIAATLGTSIPDNVRVITTPCDHTDLACLIRNAPLAQITADGPCSSQDIFTPPARMSRLSLAQLGVFPMFAAGTDADGLYFGGMYSASQFIFLGTPSVTDKITYHLP
ncbi:MAG: RHS repeat-associated core domain-containing protein [Acidobacteriia bacterium]|nr:RHS repeat-associated core domain-containing protein [Terriglobia bacterium]